MRASKMFLSTKREAPSDAEIASHILLLRADMIRKEVGGVYNFMPLGWRVLKKIEDIVRQEMDRAGGQEILTSAMQPAELWQESGRWYAYGPELWRVKDRNERDFCLGPTAEEVFTDTVRSSITSHKQLPFNIYQIQTKYRDEARPRFGLIRSREFIMKDAYSFDKDEAGLDKSYQDMYDAYSRVFTRCGLDFRPVEADTGAIGGNGSHEFCALAEVGEEEIIYCDNCGMAATAEKAAFADEKMPEEEMLPMEKVLTPGTKTIEDVCSFLGVPQEKSIKALLFSVWHEGSDDPEYIAVFIRGDRQLNKVKLVNTLDVPEFAVQFADEALMGPLTGAVGGFTGPVGLHDCRIIMDSELVGARNMVCGACEADHHIKNVNYGRDFKADIIADLKLLQEGDRCPVCGAPVKSAKGIEVGQVFKLRTKYSESMHAFYKDENMNEKPMVMGCYGIGVTRTMAAVVEQHHDENGIIWPMSIAPYHVIVTLVGIKDEAQKALAEEITAKLEDAGAEVILDDRDERPGVKFKDADLIGIPVRITVGKKAPERQVEFKLRREADLEVMDADAAVARALEIINAEKRG
ncbi:MAG: proline--tRNA ligase [Firmicutes bacterium]|nr:proline--tRNA ligase [Bacillota bacterium]MBQ1888769.1 proline--tRNA ligase [Bacillota bacterium]MBQ2455504.1 proline--tRNA ligase [Bacillota bacterium]